MLLLAHHRRLPRNLPFNLTSLTGVFSLAFYAWLHWGCGGCWEGRLLTCGISGPEMAWHPSEFLYLQPPYASHCIPGAIVIGNGAARGGAFLFVRSPYC